MEGGQSIRAVFAQPERTRIGRPHLSSPSGEGGGEGGGGDDSEGGGEDGESGANGDDGGKDGGGGIVVGRDNGSCATGGCACAAKIKNIKQYLPPIELPESAGEHCVTLAGERDRRGQESTV
jgi:hypothetical protein